MYNHIVRLTAPSDRMLHLWIEPWAQGLAFPANTTVELHGTSPLPGELELDESEECTAVYGWAGSTLRLLVDGEVVESFNQAVPAALTRSNISMLFGAPPVPTAAEGAFVKKSPWWKWWAKR